MVKKKRTATKARTRTVYKSAPKKRRAKSGVTMIPSAGASVGLMLANKANVVTDLNDMKHYGIPAVVKSTVSNPDRLGKYIGYNQIAKDVEYGLIGYFAGYAIQKFAPAVIKSPLGKISKKVPKLKL